MCFWLRHERVHIFGKHPKEINDASGVLHRTRIYTEFINIRRRRLGSGKRCDGKIPQSFRSRKNQVHVCSTSRGLMRSLPTCRSTLASHYDLCVSPWPMCILQIIEKLNARRKLSLYIYTKSCGVTESNVIL